MSVLISRMGETVHFLHKISYVSCFLRASFSSVHLISRSHCMEGFRLTSELSLLTFLLSTLLCFVLIIIVIIYLYLFLLFSVISPLSFLLLFPILLLHSCSLHSLVPFPPPTRLLVALRLIVTGKNPEVQRKYVISQESVFEEVRTYRHCFSLL